jgi:hypothetical protein
MEATETYVPCLLRPEEKAQAAEKRIAISPDFPPIVMRANQRILRASRDEPHNNKSYRTTDI